MAGKTRKVIEVLLTAKDKTAAGFRSAQSGMSRLAKSAAGFARSAGLGLGLFGGAAGAGALAAVSRHAAEIDKLGKAAESLGIQVEELSKLGHAADLAGSSMVGLTDALEKMLNRVSKAAEGTGEAYGAIEELQMDAAELEKLAPEEQFKQLADAISAVGNAADQVRLKRAIFGRGDSNFINLLKQGSKGYYDAAAGLEKLDAVVTKADTDAAAAYADSMLRLSTNIEAIGKSYGGPAIDVLNELFSFFGLDSGIGNVNTEIEKLNREISRTKRLLSDNEGGIAEWFVNVVTPDSELKSRLDQYQTRLDELLKIQADYNRQAAEQEDNKDAIAAAQKHGKKLKNIQDTRLRVLKDALKAKEDEYERHAGALEDARDRQKDLMQDIADATEEFEDYGSEQEVPDRFDIVEATSAVWNSIKAGDLSGARAALQKLIDMFRAYQEAGKASRADVVTMTGQLEALGDAIGHAAGAGLDEMAEKSAAVVKSLKTELQKKPVTVNVEASKNSGDKVIKDVQKQVDAETHVNPIIVPVGIGLAWGGEIPGAATPGNAHPGADIESESNKRGFRL